MAGRDTDHINVLFLYLLIISLLALSNSSFVNEGPNGLSIKIVHRDSIESPLYPGDLTIEERVQRLVQQSKARSSFLTLRKSIAGNITRGTIHPEARLPVSWEGSYYIAEIGIGTFYGRPQYKSYSLIVDTGSALTWLQCQGCAHCFHQDKPLIPYRKSSSYMGLQCNIHPLCDRGKCYGPICSYSTGYIDGSTTSGYLASETLTVFSERGGVEEIKPFVFGCGLDQQNWSPIGDGRQKGKPDVIAGILGISGSLKSFVRQLGDRGKNRFSYCLPPYTDGATTSTFLRFGDDANIVSNNRERIYTTPITTLTRESVYYLELLDVSIDGKRLGFPPNTFEVKSDRSGGCILDSGTTITHFPKREYEVIKLSVVKYFRNLGLEPLTHPLNSGFDLCYTKPTRGLSNFPKITFHFRDADFDAEFGFMSVDTHFCLGILPIGGIIRGSVIIGTHQTANHRLLYDLNIMKLSFAKERCQ